MNWFIIVYDQWIGVRVVALDLPTSWTLVKVSEGDIQRRMLDAVNGMMFDMLAALARKATKTAAARARGSRKPRARGCTRAVLKTGSATLLSALGDKLPNEMALIALPLPSTWNDRSIHLGTSAQIFVCVWQADRLEVPYIRRQ